MHARIHLLNSKTGKAAVRVFAALIAAGVSVCANLICASAGVTNDIQATIRLADVQGRSVRPLAVDGRAATCLVFISSACPISDSYAPEIGRIAAAYAPAKIQTFAVLTDDDVSQTNAAVYVSSYRFSCPVLRDPQHLLVHAAGVDVTPEAAVFDHRGVLVYRGRIDNKFVDFGVSRQAATRKDLRAVLDAIRSGRDPAFTQTKAVGCFIPPLAR